MGNNQILTGRRISSRRIDHQGAIFEVGDAAKIEVLVVHEDEDFQLNLASAHFLFLVYMLKFGPSLMVMSMHGSSAAVRATDKHTVNKLLQTKNLVKPKNHRHHRLRE